MPQASDELRQKMMRRFGSIDTHGPEDFLKKVGYTLGKDWLWTPKPGVTDYRDMTQEEFDCLSFLLDEWDYGPLTGDPSA